MVQTKADLWTLETIPTVTSFFELSLIDGHSADIIRAPVTTGRCGLGWSFIFQAVDGGINKPLWGASTAKQTLFTISLLATNNISSLEKLLVNVEAKKNSISETTVHASEISLSDSKATLLVSILSLVNFTGNIPIEIHVVLPTTFNHVGDPNRKAEQRLHHSLAQSLLGEGLGDVTFALFAGVGGYDVTNPRLLYANSSLIRGYNTFIDNLLSDTKEREVATVGDLSPPVYNTYDYTSDSDLESNSDADEHQGHNSRLLWSSSSTNAASQEPLAQSTRQKLDDHESVVLIRDTAYSTWKALIFYLYTREIHFKPLTSSSTMHDVEDRSPNVSCSPKSMFRLATKIGSEELRTLSLRAIIREISKDNVVEELFSHFTSMYHEVQTAQTQALIPLLKEHSVAQKLVDKMKDLATQGVPRSGAIVASIVGRLVELAANGNEDKPLGDKNDDDAGDCNDEDGDDDNREDKKKKNKRNDHNVKKRQDKDVKPSEGDKSKGKGDKNEYKPREGDKNKPKPGEGDKNNPRLALADGDKYKLELGGGKYEKFKMEPSGAEEAVDSSDGFTFVGPNVKGGRFDTFHAGRS